MDEHPGNFRKVGLDDLDDTTRDDVRLIDRQLGRDVRVQEQAVV